VVGPDGKPLSGVEVVGLTATPDDEMLDGPSFTVQGLNPRCGRDLFFRHGGQGLGKALTVRGDEAGPLTVQLEPCGSVIGRVVDKGGEPVPRVSLSFRLGDRMDVVAETDRDGCFRAALLSWQKYTLAPYSPRRLLKDVGDIEVESGQTKDLGDLPLAD
jgi:hypothetical protein